MWEDHFRKLLAAVKANHKQGERIMAKLDALAAAVDKLDADVAAVLAALATETTDQGTIDALTQKVTDASAKLEAAVAPPPAPAG